MFGSPGSSLRTIVVRAQICVGALLFNTPYLNQSLLHGGPIGNPPSTFEHEVRVGMAFGLAVFCQRLPLVQFL